MELVSAPLGAIFLGFLSPHGPFGPIWARGPWAHMGQGPWAHGPGPILKFFGIFGSLMAPSDFFIARKMLAIGLSNFHKFTEMCQIYGVLLSWFYFSLKTHFVILSHLEWIQKTAVLLKLLVARGQASLFIFWKVDTFGFLMLWEGGWEWTGRTVAVEMYAWPHPIPTP